MPLIPKSLHSPSGSVQSSRHSSMDLDPETLDLLDEPLQDFPIGLGSALDMFREKEEVLGIIRGTPQLSQDKLEPTLQHYRSLLDRYQEQPHLLDPHLDEMIGLMIEGFLALAPGSQRSYAASPFLRHLFKVRTPKPLLARLPNGPAHLVPVLNQLESIDLSDPTHWDTVYILLMWLSILVINPFHLALLDGGRSSGEEEAAERLLKITKEALAVTGSVGTEAAPLLAGKFLTRPDQQKRLGEFLIGWGCGLFKNESAPFATRLGAFTALGSIFKLGQRKELLPYASQVLDSALKSGFERSDSIVLRKAGVKLVQRIGLVFLRGDRVAPWRYQRGGRRNLLENLKQSETNQQQHSGTEPTITSQQEQQDDEDVATYSVQLEQTLNLLFHTLSDQTSTLIRYSSAKGLGRLTVRLPSTYAMQILSTLLSSHFNPLSTHTSWHGGCLALAELARRGLLDPTQLASVIPILQQALVYDEIRGNFSVGAHVRDAACYVLWAFARAFDNNVLESYVKEIASCLIVVMLFDREVNVRRAAAAAFQESVGRLGNFPGGIDIVGVADYFAVGVRGKSFGSVCTEIAKLTHPLYTQSMIDHLLTLKFNHFDPSIRRLTAETLGNLSLFDADYVMQNVIPKLLKAAGDFTDVCTSHGGFLALAAVTLKLKEKLDKGIYAEIRELTKRAYREKLKSSLRGNELLRQGVAALLGACAQGRISSLIPSEGDPSEFLTTCLNILEDNLSSVDPATRNATSTGHFPIFLTTYYYDLVPENRQKIPEILKILCRNLHTPALSTRQGNATTLGRIPVHVMSSSFPHILQSLLGATKPEKDHTHWVEPRRDSLDAITYIFMHKKFIKEEVDYEKGIPLSVFSLEETYDTILESLQDYTTDKRGDIGSWVRSSAATALKVLTIRLNEVGEVVGKISEDKVPKTVSLVAKQSIEKIDNLRVHCGETFAILLHQKQPIQGIPFLTEMKAIFPRDFCLEVNWRASSLTFSRFAELLRFDCYIEDVLEGFAISGGGGGGGGGDSLARDALGAVGGFLVAASELEGAEGVRRVGRGFVRVFEKNPKKDRVILPLLKFTTQLLQSGVFSSILDEEEESSFGLQLLECVKRELAKCGKVEKILAGVELLCELVGVAGGADGLVRRGSLKRLMIYLCHTYPRVRAVTAGKLYEALLTYGGGGDEGEDLTVVMGLLSETQWDRDDFGRTGEGEGLREVRRRICQCVGVPEPVGIGSTSR